MTNPDFLLESRTEVTDAMEHIGAALGELRFGYDKKTWERGPLADRMANESAEQAIAKLNLAIGSLVKARDLARRSMMEEEA